MDPKNFKPIFEQHFSDNPLSIPHEIKTNNNIQKSTFLDASLLELPNISVDKSNGSSFSYLDQLLINKYKENETSIRLYIKINNSNNDSRVLIIDKDTFSDLFKIYDKEIINNVFILYSTLNNSNSNSNNNSSNRSGSSSSDNSNKKNRKKKSVDNNSNTYNNDIKIPFNSNHLNDNNNSQNHNNNNNNNNTLKTPIGGDSFPIPVDSFNISSIDSNLSYSLTNSNDPQSSASTNSNISSLNTTSIYSNPSNSSSQGSLSNTSTSNGSGVASSTDTSPTSSKSNISSSLIDHSNNFKTFGSSLDNKSRYLSGANTTITNNDSCDIIKQDLHHHHHHITNATPTETIEDTDQNDFMDEPIEITPPNCNSPFQFINNSNSNNNNPQDDNGNNSNNSNNSGTNEQTLSLKQPISATTNSTTSTTISTQQINDKLIKHSKKKNRQQKKSIKKLKSLDFSSIKINLFDLINQIYLNLSKIGSEDERISSVFNLYDIYGRGFISRNDLKEVLLYRTNQNGLKLSDFTLESLMDHIFEQFDKNNDGFIDFNEFKKELNNSGSNKNNKSIRNSSNNIGNSSGTNSNNNGDLEINKKEMDPDTEEGEEFSRYNIKRYFKIEGSKLFFMSLFFMVNIAILIYSFFLVHSKNQRAIQLFGPGLYITRVAAQLIEFNAAIILLTMCKQLFTMLRNTRFRALFPVDKYMTFHKLIGYTLLIASLLHTIGWIVGMAIATGKPDAIFYDCLYPHFEYRPTVWQMIFNSLPGVTGVIMIFIILIMCILSIKAIRKSNFELFYYSHHLFIGFYILLILHGTMGWIRPPTFWKWFIGPGFLYMVDRGFRLFKKTYKVNLVDFSLKNERVINLTFSKPSSFNYKPGQYLLINIPQISRLQWHPFTMTSSPLEENVHVHIRVTGGWTRKLFRYLSNIKKEREDRLNGSSTNDGSISIEMEKEESIQIHVDGPFGSSSQYALNHKQVILVGAGIGVAPMASLLQDISIKKEKIYNEDKINQQEYETPEQHLLRFNEIKRKYGLGDLEKVHFFWLNRDQKCFQWFEDLLIDISKNGNNVPKISINTFNTRCFPKNDVRVFMVWNGLDRIFKSQGLDPTTNLPFKTHWGRPNWDAIFEYYSKKYSGETISVFCCGPPELSKELYEKCRYNTSLKSNGTKFYFHKENF